MKKVIYLLIFFILAGVVTMRVIENNTAPKLGVQNGELKPLGSRPNSVSTQTDKPDKQVKSIAFDIEAKQQMQKVQNVIDAMPGAKILQQSDHYLYAVFTSPLMRFKDDVEVYLDDEQKRIHFRSASRVGYSDLGVNRKRYEDFARRLSVLSQ